MDGTERSNLDGGGSGGRGDGREGGISMDEGDEPNDGTTTNTANTINTKSDIYDDKAKESITTTPENGTNQQDLEPIIQPEPYSSSSSSSSSTAYHFDTSQLRQRATTREVFRRKQGFDAVIDTSTLSQQSTVPGAFPRNGSGSSSSSSSSVSTSTTTANAMPIRPTFTVSSSNSSTSPSSPASSSQQKSPQKQSSKPNEPTTSREEEISGFECNICLDIACNPVVTTCGHLFCWSCLRQWLESTSPTAQSCPVCKGGLTRDKIIPVFTKGKERQDPRDEPSTDPSSSSSSRPPPQRAPPPRQQRPTGPGFFFDPFFGPGFGGNANGMNWSFSSGFGLFPGMSFSFGGTGGSGVGNNVQNNQQPGTMAPEQQAQQIQEFMSRLFTMIGLLIMITILLY